MKRTIVLAACLMALTACGNNANGDDGAPVSRDTGADNNAADTNTGGGQAGNAGGDFASTGEKRSYALGMDIGNSLKNLPIDVDTQALSEGVRDTVGGGQTRLSQKQLKSVMQDFVQEMKAQQQQKKQKNAKANQQKGEKFLARNKKRDGVETTDSGLQYKIEKKGQGPSPDENDKVTVHYVGKLLDGTVFDSSRKRGEPVTFPVNAVIPGWTEALQMMHEGAKYKLFIPADLAYGERGAEPKIGPNQTLEFDVELLKVDKQSGESGGVTGGAAGAASGASGNQLQGQPGASADTDAAGGASVSGGASQPGGGQSRPAGGQSTGSSAIEDNAGEPAGGAQPSAAEPQAGSSPGAGQQSPAGASSSQMQGAGATQDAADSQGGPASADRPDQAGGARSPGSSDVGGAGGGAAAPSGGEAGQSGAGATDTGAPATGGTDSPNSAAGQSSQVTSPDAGAANEPQPAADEDQSVQ